MDLLFPRFAAGSLIASIRLIYQYIVVFSTPLVLNYLQPQRSDEHDGRPGWSPRSRRRSDAAVFAGGTSPLYPYLVTIQLNSSPETYPEDSLTVAEILARKRWSFPLVIVKVDGELVEREDYASRRVPDGAAVEAYHLVSGG